MVWTTTIKRYRYTVIGFITGILIWGFGTWLEFKVENLPFQYWSLGYLHRTQPLIITFDFAPVVFGLIGWLLDRQRNLLQVISRAKKEWETIFDVFNDLIFVTDASGTVIRCNHAVVDRLNSSFLAIIGKPISEILRTGENDADSDFQKSEHGFSWLGRLYDVSTFPIEINQTERQNLFILHDITLRVRMENNLSRERTLLRTLIDNLPDRIYVKDLQGVKTISNASDWRASGGNRMEDVVGKSDFDLYTPELANKYWADDETVLSSGAQILNREEPGRDYQGNPAWIMTTKVPLRDEEGKITGLVGIGRDITHQKLAEEKLRQLSTAVEQSASTILITDTTGRIVYVNPKFTEITGYTEEEALGKNPRILKSGFTTLEEYQRLWQTITSGGVWKGEFHNRKKDGQLYWESATISGILNEAGEVTHFLGVKEDITERKRVEAELLREKLFQEALIRNSPTSIVVLDTQGNILSCNPAFERLFGYTTQEAVGKNLDSLITTPETIEQASTYTQQSLSGLVHGFGKRRRKDGSFASVEIFGVPIIVGEERVGALAIYHDITELDRARREAEEASRTKSEFLANMSHEIRTPMNGVMGMLELALETQLTSEQRDYLETSLHSAEALLALLNDILDFSKIEAGRLELEKINFNLRNTVEDVAYTLAARAQAKGLEIACLIHPELSSSLRGDPGRLRQILVNLVGNAIKFTHQGEIVIQAEAIEETQSSAVVHFSVQDTGVGIPLERQAAIFDRFTQADGSTTRKYGGTGLGLTISKQLVEAMRGKIGVNSDPGVGSTFWFDIQFEKQPREKQGTAPLSPLGPVNLSAARILVIDDNQTNRLVLTKNVEAMGCRVDAVASGAKGLESLRNAHRSGDPHHVVLLDMQMPGMDGEQTARAIKSDPAVKDVKIIILTSMGHRGDAARMEALGCAGYLLKPVKQQLLFEATLAVLGREKEEAPALITRHILSEQKKFGARLLLAEDNPINQKLAVTVLQKAGYSVDTVDNGADAVEKAMANTYAAILMDVQMPGTDGFEATQQIREWEKDRNHRIPIIAMTAHAMQGDRERCLEAGMDDYVTKPLQPRVLFSALNRWTQNDSVEAEVPENIQDYSSQEEAFSMDFDDGMFGEPASEPAPAETPAFGQSFASSTDNLPIDLPSAISRFDDDRDFVITILHDYKAQLPERLKELRQLLQARDANSLCRIAHNLKGVSLNISAGPIARAALAIEQTALREDLTSAAEYLNRLEAEVDHFNDYVSGMNL
jgi:PAS domain S-box-containing protein